MGIRSILIILTITGASDLSGAFAQSANVNDISSIIRGVTAEITDTIPEFNDNTDIENDYVAGAESILDNIIYESIKSEKKSVSSESVLDFMANAYIHHDFYQTGKWDDAEDFSYIIRNVTLPPYDPNDFYRPVWGRVTSTYGFRKSFGRMHKGIDLALNVGDTVRAALPGVVARVGYDAGGYGHFVVVVHNNGMETRYAHLQKSVSSPGERLDAGEPLGLGGNTGNSTGPHLHFEIRYRGSAVDPASVFDFSKRSIRKTSNNKGR